MNEYYGEETAGTHDPRAGPDVKPPPASSCCGTATRARTTSGSPTCIPPWSCTPTCPNSNGQDLTNYEDQRGKKLFVAFVDAVRENGSGFVDYYWQWKDDPNRIVPKLSYVELFQPWQWVIGTGIYVEDVNAAIARVQRNLTYISLAIIVAIALLLLYAARQSMKIEKRRAAAEQGLKESHEKYQALVAAATEGIVMTLDGKCAYSNKPLQDMLGYEPANSST